MLTHFKHFPKHTISPILTILQGKGEVLAQVLWLDLQISDFSISYISGRCQFQPPSSKFLMNKLVNLD